MWGKGERDAGIDKLVLEKMAVLFLQLDVGTSIRRFPDTQKQPSSPCSHEEGIFSPKRLR